MNRFEAEISQEWIDGIKPHDVFRLNTYSAEDIHAEIDLRLLGGLTILLTKNLIFGSDDIERASSVQHIINLTAGEPAVHTNTNELIEAAEQQRGKDSLIAHQLMQRRFQISDHGPNEPWFLPVSGVKIIEKVAASSTS